MDFLKFHCHTQIHKVYSNSCMFDMPNQKPVQNSQSWKYQKVQNLNSVFSCLVLLVSPGLDIFFGCVVTRRNLNMGEIKYFSF